VNIQIVGTLDEITRYVPRICSVLGEHQVGEFTPLGDGSAHGRVIVTAIEPTEAEPAGQQGELPTTGTCSGGDLGGPDGDEPFYCNDDAVPGSEYCAAHDHGPVSETNVAPGVSGEADTTPQPQVWTRENAEEPKPPAGGNFPKLVDAHGVRWVADEREDGFEGWRSDSHGFRTWRAWAQLLWQRGPLTEVLPEVSSPQEGDER